MLIAGLAFFLFWIGSLLRRIASNLEECAVLVRKVNADAAKIVAAGTAVPARPSVARPTSGTRLHEAVGFRPR